MFKYKYSPIVLFLYRPLDLFVKAYLLGEFIKLVDFYGIKVSYFLLVLTGLAVHEALSTIGSNLSRAYGKRIKTILLTGSHNYFVASYLNNFVLVLISYYASILVASTLLHLSTKEIFIFSLILLLSYLFTIALDLIMTALLIKFKRESRVIFYTTETLLFSIFPIYFSLAILPQPVRELVEIILPPAGILEELRKLIFLGTFNSTILFLDLIVSLAYIFLAYAFFEYILYDARKKGYIFLQ